MTDDALQREWETLLHASERYEHGALAIKLAGVAVVVATAALGAPALVAVVPLAVLWLQEGIFRTSQARLAARLVRIEQALDAGTRDAAYRLHVEWMAQRPGVGGLVTEYLRQALRPTVAFPYPVLILLAALASAPH